MKPELAAKLAVLQKHLIVNDDESGLALFAEVWQAIKQDEEWEQIAVWAASCQAATAEGYASRKSASKGERTRHVNLQEAQGNDRERLVHGAPWLSAVRERQAKHLEAAG